VFGDGLRAREISALSQHADLAGEMCHLAQQDCELCGREAAPNADAQP
jgi:hypothetical protein